MTVRVVVTIRVVMTVRAVMTGGADQVGDLSLITMDPFQRDAESPRWWMPMGISSDDLVTLHSLADLVPYLRAVPKKHIAKMQVIT